MNLLRMKGAIKKAVSRFLNKHLPSRTKRLVFLASFAARLKESTVLEKETIQKLNKVLTLATTDEALMFPVQLSRVIWHGKTSYEICNEDLSEGSLSSNRIAEVANAIMAAMPEWLRYDDASVIEKDVEVLLVNRNIVLGT